jgi:hypothetical protein
MLFYWDISNDDAKENLIKRQAIVIGKYCKIRRLKFDWDRSIVGVLVSFFYLL